MQDFILGLLAGTALTAMTLLVLFRRVALVFRGTGPLTRAADEFTRRLLALERKMYLAARAELGNHDDAMDAVQDAVLKLWGKASEVFTANDSFLIHAARLEARTIRAKRDRRRDLDAAVLVPKVRAAVEHNATPEGLRNVIAQEGLQVAKSQGTLPDRVSDDEYLEWMKKIV